MAKIIEYPRASLANALHLAESVDALGGGTTNAMAAEKMGRKVSGAFSAVVSAAVKYSLLSAKQGRLATTSLFRNIKLAYNEDERRRHLRAALLSPPIFAAIADRFSGRQLPIDHFDRLLIREFGVSDEIAPRVASYFLEGAHQAGMLTADSALVSQEERPTSDEPMAATEAGVGRNADDDFALESGDGPESPTHTAQFSVTFRGPGLTSTVTISDEDDMAIVEATLRKITKALKTIT